MPKDYDSPYICGAHGPHGARCGRGTGHDGRHWGEIEWVRPLDLDADADTVQFPPIRETVRRRPPAPVVRALTDRVELLEAMAAELGRELAELRAVDDDQADDEGRRS